MKYDQVEEGDWHSVDRKDNLEECCDCSLVHRVEYKVAKGKIWFRCWVENRITNAKRKRRGIKIVATGKR